MSFVCLSRRTSGRDSLVDKIITRFILKKVFEDGIKRVYDAILKTQTSDRSSRRLLATFTELSMMNDIPAVLDG